MLITKNNQLDVRLIHPSKGAKYSPNLYRWMKKEKNGYAPIAHVYRDKDAILWIGLLEGRELFGSKLMGVLCNGAKESTAAWQRIDAAVVPNFWHDYVAIGRCAIDRQHSMSFIGDEARWSINGETRSCLWCNEHHQVNLKWTETIQKSQWVTA